ncbi:hypothetical protein HK098_004326 [Nowakowskiella sp. JEL0407]|nr:hypothetical protein HK098_004326 [Nowakowskiella sp. JEL0407]
MKRRSEPVVRNEDLLPLSQQSSKPSLQSQLSQVRLTLLEKENIIKQLTDEISFLKQDRIELLREINTLKELQHSYLADPFLSKPSLSSTKRNSSSTLNSKLSSVSLDSEPLSDAINAFCAIDYRQTRILKCQLSQFQRLINIQNDLVVEYEDCVDRISEEVSKVRTELKKLHIKKEKDSNAKQSKPESIPDTLINIADEFTKSVLRIKRSRKEYQIEKEAEVVLKSNFIREDRKHMWSRSVSHTRGDGYICLEDVLSGKVDHLNLTVISKLEERLRMVYKDLLQFQISFKNASPIHKQEQQQKNQFLFERLSNSLACTINSILSLCVLIPTAPVLLSPNVYQNKQGIVRKRESESGFILPSIDELVAQLPSSIGNSNRAKVKSVLEIVYKYAKINEDLVNKKLEAYQNL